MRHEQCSDEVLRALDAVEAAAVTLMDVISRLHVAFAPADSRTASVTGAPEGR